VSSGQIINDYFNEAAVDGSALGNHEFDFSPNFLFDYMEKRDDPSIFLAANLRSEKD
jgi:2',3'-cyclic-nucleotide 2'-phosphodiesterase (5'-nucleotidase family)